MFFIQKFNKEHGRKIIGCTAATIKAFQQYDWPGNIRELENVIEHAFVMESENRIDVNSLPEKFLETIGLTPKQMIIQQEAGSSAADSSEELISEEGGIIIPDDNLDFSKHKEMFEREFILKALKMFKGRINQTALHANIPKKTLLRKIEKYGINPKDFYLQ